MNKFQQLSPKDFFTLGLIQSSLFWLLAHSLNDREFTLYTFPSVYVVASFLGLQLAWNYQDFWKIEWSRHYVLFVQAVVGAIAFELDMSLALFLGCLGPLWIYCKQEPEEYFRDGLLLCLVPLVIWAIGGFIQGQRAQGDEFLLGCGAYIMGMAGLMYFVSHSSERSNNGQFKKGHHVNDKNEFHFYRDLHYHLVTMRDFLVSKKHQLPDSQGKQIDLFLHELDVLDSLLSNHLLVDSKKSFITYGQFLNMDKNLQRMIKLFLPQEAYQVDLKYLGLVGDNSEWRENKFNSAVFFRVLTNFLKIASEVNDPEISLSIVLETDKVTLGLRGQFNELMKEDWKMSSRLEQNILIAENDVRTEEIKICIEAIEKIMESQGEFSFNVDGAYWNLKASVCIEKTDKEKSTQMQAA